MGESKHALPDFCPYTKRAREIDKNLAIKLAILKLG
jgi:hypothetical protein